MSPEKDLGTLGRKEGLGYTITLLMHSFFPFLVRGVGVRVRRMRTHDPGARGSLRAFEGQSPVVPGPPQVLRQATFQIHQRQLQQHSTPSPVVADGSKERRSSMGETREDNTLTFFVCRLQSLVRIIK